VDLIAYGLIPEFVGRFPVLVGLEALTEEQLVEVSGRWNDRCYKKKKKKKQVLGVVRCFGVVLGFPGRT